MWPKRIGGSAGRWFLADQQLKKDEEIVSPRVVYDLFATVAICATGDSSAPADLAFGLYDEEFTLHVRVDVTPERDLH